MRSLSSRIKGHWFTNGEIRRTLLKLLPLKSLCFGKNPPGSSLSICVRNIWALYGPKKSCIFSFSKNAGVGTLNSDSSIVVLFSILYSNILNRYISKNKYHFYERFVHTTVTISPENKWTQTKHS